MMDTVQRMLTSRCPKEMIFWISHCRHPQSQQTILESLSGRLSVLRGGRPSVTANLVTLQEGIDALPCSFWVQDVLIFPESIAKGSSGKSFEH